MKPSGGYLRKADDLHEEFQAADVFELVENGGRAFASVARRIPTDYVVRFVSLEVWRPAMDGVWSVVESASRSGPGGAQESTLYIFTTDDPQELVRTAHEVWAAVVRTATQGGSVSGNPVLRKRKKGAYLGKHLVPDVPDDVLEENLVIFGPLGVRAQWMIGTYSPETYIAYFLIKPEDKPLFIAAARGEGGRLPLFMGRRMIGGPGTISQFWQNRLAKKLAGAFQFYVDDENNQVVGTHVGVKPAWRLHGVASRLVRYVHGGHEGKELLLHDLTDQGRAWMEGSGIGREYEANPDEGRRRRGRRAATEGVHAQVRYLTDRLRAGTLDPDRLRAAALLNDPAALLVTNTKPTSIYVAIPPEHEDDPGAPPGSDYRWSAPIYFKDDPSAKDMDRVPDLWQRMALHAVELAAGEVYPPESKKRRASPPAGQDASWAAVQETLSSARRVLDRHAADFARQRLGELAELWREELGGPHVEIPVLGDEDEVWVQIWLALESLCGALGTPTRFEGAKWSTWQSRHAIQNAVLALAYKLAWDRAPPRAPEVHPTHKEFLRAASMTHDEIQKKVVPWLLG
jgi:hypothetical protein